MVRGSLQPLYKQIDDDACANAGPDAGPDARPDSSDASADSSADFSADCSSDASPDFSSDCLNHSHRLCNRWRGQITIELWLHFLNRRHHAVVALMQSHLTLRIPLFWARKANLHSDQALNIDAPVPPSTFRCHPLVDRTMKR